MNELTRRDFITRAAGAVAAGLAIPGLGEAKEPLSATSMRPLGNTGLRPTLLGMGTGVKSWGGESELTRKGDDVFIQTVTRAYEKGIRYFDLADMYGSHPYFNKLLKGPIDRGQVVLVTKTTAKDPAVAKEDLARFQKELDVDGLDIVLMHCVTDAQWVQKMAPVMEVLADAKAKGIIKAHGLSCHTLEALEAAAETPWVDVVLARINKFGIKMDAEPQKVAPVLQRAKGNGKGVLGMKIVGEGDCADRLPESLDYVLGLGCVDAMPIGLLSPQEVDDTIAKVSAAAAKVA